MVNKNCVTNAIIPLSLQNNEDGQSASQYQICNDR